MVAQLSQLILSNVRNLSSLDLIFHHKFNVFVGCNGSGKTSLLEAIYLLGIGRSFRARTIQQIITFGRESCVIRAKITPPSNYNESDVWVGVNRSLNGSAQYRIGELNSASASEISGLLPVQLIDVNSPLLIEGGPNERRQFIDWGVFHVEQTFLESWRLMQRALQQRNALLKQKRALSQEWDAAFIKYALLVDAARTAYLRDFCDIFVPMLQEMLNLGRIELKYQHGWSEQCDLQAALERNARIDALLGYTNCGPHRADLEIYIDGRPAKSVLSRGQTKIFVCVMLLARARLLVPKRNCVFLIDDLHAELDSENCGLLLAALQELECQVFITGIEAELLKDRLSGCDAKMFHVEQGRVSSYATEQQMLSSV